MIGTLKGLWRWQGHVRSHICQTKNASFRLNLAWILRVSFRKLEYL